MPTPLQILLDPVSLIVIAMYAALMVWEYFFPARQLEHVPNWRLRGLLAFIVYFFVSSYLPLFWDNSLAKLQLFNLTSWNVVSQTALALVVYEFVLYVWHRVMHSSPFLWKTFHQMHHSAERLDTYGAFWLSPMDMIGFTFISSFALVIIIGIDAKAATAFIFITMFFAVFQHANIRTPRWLGYIVQRPESHSRHHGKNIHRDNYADLPIFDILFGTFYNPKDALATGFYSGASSRVIDMLLFRDINKATQSTETNALAKEA